MPYYIVMSVSTIQPPAHISPFTRPISSSLLVCQYLAPGWLGVWLELFLFKSFLKLPKLMCPYCGMLWSCACILSSSAVCSSVLEFHSLYCTLWKRGQMIKKKNLPSAGSIDWISNPPFHLYHSHWKSCWCFSFTVTYHNITNFTRRLGFKFVP